MKWTKLKKLVQDRFCESLKSRVSINSTAYGNCSCGHAWITLDGIIIANCCTRAYWNRTYYNSRQKQYVQSDETEKEKIRYRNQFVEYGEFSRQDFYDACFRFIHDLQIETALKSKSGLLQSLAILDKRVGSRRLKRISMEKLHPLARGIFKERVLVR